ncbi:hypothetical protein NC653_010622 [Populus alba x Populus x berolinensis]|uniref:Uncharacterized protein n=1 Tax=Populus alba x Populus x berolinensis TaxID=444605 RepID=A0AAD6R043_9ROSI|nr:hypothetical protein NC653_010622 [Populus alba x Populus x berolinensis]
MIGLDFSKQLAALVFKLCEAVFQIPRAGKSLELITQSFRLLHELDNASSRESVAGGTRFAQVANEGNLQALEMEHLGDLNSLSSCCRNHELDLSKGVLAPSEVLFLLSFVLC